jgi:tetratricopeptide (TPR) repeat protein/O-antigen ligase
MIQNFFKFAFPLSTLLLVINMLSVLSGLAPRVLGWLPKVSEMLYLGTISPIVTSIFLLSIGYYFSSLVYNKRIESYDDARHLALSAIFAMPLIPIIFSPTMLYPYITGKAFAFRFLSLILISSFIYTAFTNKLFRIRITPLTVATTFFTLAIGISNIFGVDFAKSFWGNFERMDGYLTLLSVWVLIVSVTSLRLKDLEWSKLAKIHIWAATFVSGLGILQSLIGYSKIASLGGLPILGFCVPLGLQGVPGFCKVDSTLGNPIYLGIYAALTAWLVFYIIAKNNFKASLTTWLAFVINISIPFVFTVTRSVWVGVFAGIFTALLTYFWLTKNRKYGSITMLIILGLGILAAVFTFFGDKSFIQNIPFLNRLFDLNTLFARWNVWQIALNSFTENPIFGWGQESFINAFNKNYNPLMYGQEVYFDHPHNSYAGWLFMGGILGFVTYLATLASGVYGSIKTYFTNLTEENTVLLPIVLGTIVTYLVHSFFVFDNLTTSILVAFLFVYFGRNFAYGNLALGNVEMGMKKPLAIVLGLLTLILGFISFWKPIVANKTLIEAMTYENKATTPVDAINGTRTIFEKALNLNTFANYEILEQFLQKSLRYEQLGRQTKEDTIKTSIENFKMSAVGNFTNYVNSHPEDHRSRFALGLYYTSLGQLDLAKTTLTQALALAPNKQVPMIALAKVLLVKGEKDEAFKLYQKALDVVPKNFPSNFNSKYNELRIEYIKALMLDKRDAEAVKVIQEMLPVSSPTDFQSLINSMMQIYAGREDLKGVVNLLVEAIKISPTNANFYVWLAQALAYGGDYNGALQTITAINSQYPDVVVKFTEELQKLSAQKKSQQAAQVPVQTEPAKVENKVETATKSIKK